MELERAGALGGIQGEKGRRRLVWQVQAVDD